MHDALEEGKAASILLEGLRRQLHWHEIGLVQDNTKLGTYIFKESPSSTSLNIVEGVVAMSHKYAVVS